MSNSASCDLNKNITASNYMICATIQNVIVRSKSLYSKTISIGRFFDTKSKLQKILKCTQNAWNKFLKPTINTLAPVIGTAVSLKTKNPKIGQGKTNVLKSILVGKILSPSDIHRHGLRLKVR